MAHCTAARQFTSQAGCLGACVAFAQGPVGATSGNSLECRATHAAAAASAPATECPAAGPAGDGTCGANCEGFCTVAMGVCPSQFATFTDCTTACQGFAGNATHFTATSSSGNTFTCRLYHLGAAAAGDPSRCDAIAVTSPICQ
jgi:hypothetical protein